MSPAKYTPQQGSLPYLVIEFLTTNPHEELTCDDIEAKFERSSRQVHSLLAEAVERGAVTRAPGDDGELVYRLGAGSPGVKTNRGRHPALAAHEALDLAAKKKATRRPPVEVDIDAISIEKSVPIPHGGRVRVMDWTGLLSRMAVGDSCSLPEQVKTTLSKACTDSKKAGTGTFTIRRISDTEVRLWRTA